MGCNNCEYVCDTPLGSYCTLTNEAVGFTECHRDKWQIVVKRCNDACDVSNCHSSVVVLPKEFESKIKANVYCPTVTDLSKFLSAYYKGKKEYISMKNSSNEAYSVRVGILTVLYSF